jgi:hypothetical protein
VAANGGGLDRQELGNVGDAVAEAVDEHDRYALLLGKPAERVRKLRLEGMVADLRCGEEDGLAMSSRAALCDAKEVAGGCSMPITRCQCSQA